MSICRMSWSGGRLCSSCQPGQPAPSGATQAQTLKPARVRAMLSMQETSAKRHEQTSLTLDAMRMRSWSGGRLCSSRLPVMPASIFWSHAGPHSIQASTCGSPSLGQRRSRELTSLIRCAMCRMSWSGERLCSSRLPVRPARTSWSTQARPAIKLACLGADLWAEHIGKVL